MTKWYRSDFRWNFLIRDFSSKFEWTLKFPHSKYLQRCFKYRKVKVWVKNPTTALSNLNWDITIDIDLPARYCSVCVPTINQIANYWNEWRNDIAVTFVKISLYKISTKMLQISKSSGEKANCVIQFELGYYNRYSIDAKLVNPKVTPKPLESGGSKTVGRSQGAWSRSASVILDLSICLPKVS